MNYLDAPTQYAQNFTFSQERLTLIRPDDIMRFFNFQAFGTEDPQDDDAPLLRSSSIAFYKKAISYYMPNRLMTWNEIALVGNPTRSAVINNMIKFLKRKEVRGQGIESSATRPMTDDEAARMNLKLKEKKDTICQYGINAVLNFQVHLISFGAKNKLCRDV